MVETMNNDQLRESILNVEGNIKHYKEAKQHCINCKQNKKFCEKCTYYIPEMIHLDVMEERQKELWGEFEIRHPNRVR